MPAALAPARSLCGPKSSMGILGFEPHMSASLQAALTLLYYKRQDKSIGFNPDLPKSMGPLIKRVAARDASRVRERGLQAQRSHITSLVIDY